MHSCQSIVIYGLIISRQRLRNRTIFFFCLFLVLYRLKWHVLFFFRLFRRRVVADIGLPQSPSRRDVARTYCKDKLSSITVTWISLSLSLSSSSSSSSSYGHLFSLAGLVGLLSFCFVRSFNYAYYVWNWKQLFRNSLLLTAWRNNYVWLTNHSCTIPSPSHPSLSFALHKWQALLMSQLANHHRLCHSPLVVVYLWSETSPNCKVCFSHVVVCSHMQSHVVTCSHVSRFNVSCILLLIIQYIKIRYLLGGLENEIKTMKLRIVIMPPQLGFSLHIYCYFRV